jgi:catechol 2,3-dioxygenase-like lactoylglutathione lyase family enzyme
MRDLEIELDGLDHVAIRVADLESSAEWYSKVLGLKRYQLPEWGDFPLFLLAGKSGVALFPANLEDPKLPPFSKNRGVDHFAFHLSQENFKKAIQHYDALELDYTIKDHHYFDSVYTQDPDGHTVELTSIKVNPKDFYK